jgi:hypothetical protein
LQFLLLLDICSAAFVNSTIENRKNFIIIDQEKPQEPKVFAEQRYRVKLDFRRVGEGKKSKKQQQETRNERSSLLLALLWFLMGRLKENGKFHVLCVYTEKKWNNNGTEN